MKLEKTQHKESHLNSQVFRLIIHSVFMRSIVVCCVKWINKNNNVCSSGRDSVEIRNYRAAVVCLVLLCVLLMTAVIVLCVIFSQERQQLISKNTNLTNEREQLRNEFLTLGKLSLSICYIADFAKA